MCQNGLPFAPNLVTSKQTWTPIHSHLCKYTGNGGQFKSILRVAIWENETQNGKRHNVTISRLYKDGDFLASSPNVITLPVSPAIAQTAAELRATTKLKTPDAIQLATALEYRAAPS